MKVVQTRSIRSCLSDSLPGFFTRVLSTSELKNIIGYIPKSNSTTITNNMANISINKLESDEWYIEVNMC